MEFNLFNKVFRVGVTKKFSADDLLGSNIYYGGVFIGNGPDRYILVQWIEDANQKAGTPILNAVVSLA
ncbi:MULTISPECIES: hypothetical protein [unclassified Treponema]|uniref:hypothetical protein n=1 Tax=unclassified Treponema TaxID=2638727 RepID=UPI0020A53B82|nr:MULTISPECIES: hypothetical protein [unclassified Treponema]UTC67171.1 hypothetical protein E4O06_00410 [Treponema sp. OMZ 789]UTC69901.1 hypothetical protein E4O01_00410 [Treponema sp. OMZ 790]UTC72616.1 hypothetical protein E4O02_00410 [Treponema sp. OMZ 791]